ncbi:MAG: substrate-binding domain-containing protein [Anaerolineales bacterium]|nr:substrate-binding domain-containing protein [Anaerolineales bacterium]
MGASNHSSGSRKTIAVLGAQISRVWGAEFMAGVLDSAKTHDVNVVSFSGGKPTPIPSPSGKLSYGLYDLIKPGQFDGILLAADMSHGVSLDEVKNFCKIFAPTPLASFAIPIKDVPTTITDNEGGMRAVIKHLIQEHGYKRIAFLRGPKGQIEAEQRFEAYKAELKANDIRFDENLVIEGDFSPESGRAALRTLLDERGIRVQAIASSNDRMAFGVLEALEQRGISVPDSIAVTGFDNVGESQSMGVPLTTVHQSFYDIGKKSFESLLKKINGETVSDVSILPANLVVRWSCGCLPDSVHKAIVLPKEVAHTGRLENKRDAAIRALLGAAGISESDLAKSQYVEAFGNAWDVFLASLREPNRNDVFLKSVQSIVEVLQQNDYDFNTWQNVISTFRKYALGGINSNTTMLRAENLFQQARMLVGELSQRAQAYRRLQFEKQEESLNNFSFSMASAMTFEGIGLAISKHFPTLGLERWYVMLYDDVISPGSVSTPPPQNYQLLLQYDENRFEIPKDKPLLATGRLVPHGKTPEDHRYQVVVMPLSLASNRFGFMWVEMGPQDWDIYVRLKNLLSSALLRTMLVEQREQAQKEVERLFAAEQERRRGAEALSRSSRQLSSLNTVEKLPEQILEQLNQVLPYERGVLFIEDVNGTPIAHAHRGLPEHTNLNEFNLQIKGADFYKTVARKGEPLLVGDVNTIEGWSQPSWLPQDQSWLGVPLYSKDNVIGMLVLSRAKNSFTEDDRLLASTFAMQATVALENSRLYNEVTSMNQVMERMVAKRVEELNNAYQSLEKHDKNKSAFIQVAAHELRTPLTVIKGYIGMLKADSAIQNNPILSQAIDGVSRGTNRLHQVVDSMLDVARLENQVIAPHIESVNLGLILRLILKDYVDDVALRNLTLTLDEAIKQIPPLSADPELLKKALDHIIVNAIKFTPDGGSIHIAAKVVEDAKRGSMVELSVKDTGIGIDPEHHKIIFEKLYQLGEVQLHSSSRTNFKGGGAGLGLAIASGIVKALQGTIWVESEKRDEEKCPGSTFFIRLPLAKG